MDGQHPQPNGQQDARQQERPVATASRAIRRGVASGRVASRAGRAVAVPAIRVATSPIESSESVAAVGGASGASTSADGESEGAAANAPGGSATASEDAQAALAGSVLSDGDALTLDGAIQDEAKDAGIEVVPVAPDEAAEIAAQLAAAQASRQFNGHDADALGEQCNKLLALIAQLCQQTQSPMVNIGLLRTGAEAFACCQVLVERGIVSEAEMRARVYLRLRAILSEITQQLEEAALKRPERGGLAVAGRSPIQIARH